MGFLLFTGCSFQEAPQLRTPRARPFSSDVQEELNPQTKDGVRIEDLDETLHGSSSSIEITLAADGDSQNAEGFLIRYGYAANELINEIRVPRSALAVSEDPSAGSVYKYRIENLLPDKILFLTVQSFHGSEVSAPTTVFEVPVERRRRN